MKPQDGTRLPDDTLLSEVILTTRAEHVAARAGIKTVGDLRRMSDQELARLPECGELTRLEFRLLTGQRPTDKPTLSERAAKQRWVRAIRFGTCECSFEQWKREDQGQ